MINNVTQTLPADPVPPRKRLLPAKTFHNRQFHAEQQKTSLEQLRLRLRPSVGSERFRSSSSAISLPATISVLK